MPLSWEMRSEKGERGGGKIRGSKWDRHLELPYLIVPPPQTKQLTENNETKTNARQTSGQTCAPQRAPAPDARPLGNGTSRQDEPALVRGA